MSVRTDGAWREDTPASSRPFPGPPGAAATLRVAFGAGAYAALLAHAKGSVAAEVCGVLVGEVCRDDRDLFVDVQAVIEGTAAASGTAHVTYTQETWKRIHEELEAKHPNQQIVGWYHTHPGFGAEFSDMDFFIQENFFAGRTQIGYLIDPIGGEEALCMNTPEGIEHLDRFWVAGRERRARIPAPDTAEGGGVGVAADAQMRAAFLQMEARFAQLLVAVEEQQVRSWRMVLGTVMVVGLGAVLWIGSSVFSTVLAPLTPSQAIKWVPIPVQLGDHQALIGVGIHSWTIPPEANIVSRQFAQLQEAMAKQEAAARKQAQAPPPVKDDGGGGCGSPPEAVTGDPEAAAGQEAHAPPPATDDAEGGWGCGSHSVTAAKDRAAPKRPAPSGSTGGSP